MPSSPEAFGQHELVSLFAEDLTLLAGLPFAGFETTAGGERDDAVLPAIQVTAYAKLLQTIKRKHVQEL